MNSLGTKFTALMIAGAVVLATGYLATASKKIGDEVTSAAQDRDVRYARTYLKLANADLQKVLVANEKIAANMYPLSLVERLRENVKIAEEQLRQAILAKQGEEYRVHEVHILHAEAAVRIAELNLQQALAMNEKLPGYRNESELDSLRLSVEIAKLRLEKAKDPTVVGSATAHLQWQVEQLRGEVLELRLRLEKMSGRN